MSDHPRSSISLGKASGRILSSFDTKKPPQRSELLASNGILYHNNLYRITGNRTLVNNLQHPCNRHSDSARYKLLEHGQLGPRYALCDHLRC